MTDKPLLLIVEDDEVVLDLLKNVLAAEGYRVLTAKSAFQAKGLLERAQPDLLVLDRQLPDRDGLDFCREIRETEGLRGLPILCLTAKKALVDKVLGLKLGADDYVTKPFKFPELLARVGALLRRAGRTQEAPTILSSGSLEVNLDQRKAFLDGEELRLWPKEFDLLEALLRRKNRVLTREFLLRHVWNHPEGVELTTKVVDATVHRLRRRLGKLGGAIAAVKGFGYRFDSPE